MKNETEFEDECEVDDVPVSPLFSEERRNRYGSVPGLDDEELAEPWELERQVFLDEWGPVLALPVRTRRGWIQPGYDEDFGIDFGAFASVDFDRIRPEFDKALYKADKLKEQRRDVLIIMSIVKERLPKARYKVLKLLQQGIIELEDIQNEDMRGYARLYLRALRLQKQIAELREASWKRRKAKAAAWLEG
jgi:hypothetical protein